MKVAIIGYGISGASILKELIDSDSHNHIDEIHVFEKSNNIATGYAYQEDDLSLLMNSYSTRLSLNDQDPNEYVNWLKDNYPQYAQDPFSPRPIFGKYLQDKFAHYIYHNKVISHQDEVVDLKLKELSEDTSESKAYHFTIITQDNTQYKDFDYVFMSIGHPPYADHYDLSDYPGYIHTPFPISKVFDDIESDQSVGVIGSGLTGIDIMYYLQTKKDLEKPTSFYIRHEPFTNVKNELYDGELQISFDKSWIVQQQSQSGQSIPLQVMWKQLLEDMETNDVDLMEVIHNFQNGSLAEIRQQLDNVPLQLQKVQRYVGLLTEYLPDLFMALSPQDRQLFNDKFMPLFEHFRTQFPAIKLQEIVSWIDQGKVRIISQLADILVTDQHFEMINTEGLTYEEDVLVNATGFQMNLQQAGKDHAFIGNIYQDEIIQQNPLGGILVTWPIAHPLSPRYGELHQLYLTGFWIFKTQFGNNNAQMTARYGLQVAKDLLKHIKH